MTSDAGHLPGETPCGCEFFTPDERRFFAYMAEQRFRTVVEMDPVRRDALRARWREIALWFDPNYRADS